MAGRAEKALENERARLNVKLQVAHMRLLDLENAVVRIDLALAALSSKSMESELPDRMDRRHD